MNFRKMILTGAALLMAAPMFASTYYGGFEDAKGGDYDYNDLVFSLSGSSLTINTHGDTFYAKPVLNQMGTNAFWDHVSGDGDMKNVGYCMYGGGNCPTAAVDPNGTFLASKSSPAVSANNVTFSTDGSVATDVLLSITSAHDQLGWYSLNDPSTVHILNAVDQTGTFSINAVGGFGLVGIVDDTNTKYYSQISAGNNGDSTSHLAFFATPEPGSMGTLAGGLLAVGTLFRRRK